MNINEYIFRELSVWWLTLDLTTDNEDVVVK